MSTPNDSSLSAPSVHRGFRLGWIVLIVTGILIIGLILVWILLGGYWENFPLLDRLSGPRRFQQYVTRPIPEDIYEVRGGYSGFPQSFVGVRFRYHGEFSENWLFGDWLELPLETLDPIVSGEIDRKEITRVYVRGRRPKPGGYLGNQWEQYLILDDGTKRGYLYIP
jgi:hypothetical protein